MNDETKAWLYDIMNSIEEIENFFMDRPKLFAEYQKDIRTQRAVERNIEIAGEAGGRSTVRLRPFIDHERTSAVGDFKFINHERMFTFTAHQFINHERMSASIDRQFIDHERTSASIDRQFIDDERTSAVGDRQFTR